LTYHSLQDRKCFEYKVVSDFQPFNLNLDTFLHYKYDLHLQIQTRNDTKRTRRILFKIFEDQKQKGNPTTKFIPSYVWLLNLFSSPFPEKEQQQQCPKVSLKNMQIFGSGALIPLKPNSLEYEGILEFFQKSRTTNKILSRKYEWNILKISWISNQLLLKRFNDLVQFTQLVSVPKTRFGNFRLLFHGFPRKNLEKIVENGLLLAFAFSGVQLWGPGIYFSTNPDYSVNYTDYKHHASYYSEDFSKCCILLCLVFTGTEYNLDKCIETRTKLASLKCQPCVIQDTLVDSLIGTVSSRVYSETKEIEVLNVCVTSEARILPLACVEFQVLEPRWQVKC
jgi:hypothetical protein